MHWSNDLSMRLVHSRDVSRMMADLIAPSHSIHVAVVVAATVPRARYHQAPFPSPYEPAIHESE